MVESGVWKQNTNAYDTCTSNHSSVPFANEVTSLNEAFSITPPQTRCKPRVLRCARAFHLGKALCEAQAVCSHIFCWAVYRIDGSGHHRLSNKMIANVDAFGVRLVIVVLCKPKSGLVVTVQSHWVK